MYCLREFVMLFGCFIKNVILQKLEGSGRDVASKNVTASYFTSEKIRPHFSAVRINVTSSDKCQMDQKL